MPSYFSYTIPQTLRQKLNKSLSGFLPAMMTQETISLVFGKIISEPWSNALFASLSIFFNRCGEDNSQKAYAEENLQTLFIAKHAECLQESAELFITGKAHEISGLEKEKLIVFLSKQQNITAGEAEQYFLESSQSSLKKLVALAADYDVFQMIIAGLVCYYMPIPTNNPIMGKIFNAAVASSTNFALGFLAKPFSSRFFCTGSKASNNDFDYQLTNENRAAFVL